MSKHYTVTIYVAAPGTPLTKKGEPATSLTGHMFYTTSDGQNKPVSYGFAPLIHGELNGAGKLYHDDDTTYKNPHYSRTLEISPQQYDKLNAFGLHPEKYGFSKYYQGLQHNCIDFTWSALESAGIKSHTKIMGHELWDNEHHALRPNHNIDYIKNIDAPIPGSRLNTEKYNPMPNSQSAVQWLLSEGSPLPASATAILSENAKRLTSQAERLYRKKIGEIGMKCDSRIMCNSASALGYLALSNNFKNVTNLELSDDFKTIYIGDVSGDWFLNASIGFSVAAQKPTRESDANAIQFEQAKNQPQQVVAQNQEPTLPQNKNPLVQKV